MLDEDEVIIDRRNKVVKGLYDYNLQPHLGCIVLDLPEPFVKGVPTAFKED